MSLRKAGKMVILLGATAALVASLVNDKIDKNKKIEEKIDKID